MRSFEENQGLASRFRFYEDVEPKQNKKKQLIQFFKQISSFQEVSSLLLSQQTMKIHAINQNFNPQLINLDRNVKKLDSPPFQPFSRENQTRPSPKLSRSLKTHQETTKKNRISFKKTQKIGFPSIINKIELLRNTSLDSVGKSEVASLLQ